MMTTATFEALIGNAFRVKGNQIADVQGDIRRRMEAEAKAAGVGPKRWPDLSFVAGGVTGAKKKYDYSAILALSAAGKQTAEIAAITGASPTHVRCIVREARA